MYKHYFPKISTIANYEKTYSREYHFRKMHVYVNAIFYNDFTIENQYRFYPIQIINPDDHVHIFLWNFNTTDHDMYNMAVFIKNVSAKIKRPVYIHMPRTAKRMHGLLSQYLLQIYFYEELNYRFIIENPEETVSFKYGNSMPSDYSCYAHEACLDTIMTIGWDEREFANIRFDGKIYDRYVKGLVPKTRFIFPGKEWPMIYHNARIAPEIKYEISELEGVDLHLLHEKDHE